MVLFLQIQDHNCFTEAKESSTVLELKRVIQGILKQLLEKQRLYKDDQLLDDGKALEEYGFTSKTARPQAPATVGLAFHADDGWEALCLEPISSPPKLWDMKKPQDSGDSAEPVIPAFLMTTPSSKGPWPTWRPIAPLKDI